MSVRVLARGVIAVALLARASDCVAQAWARSAKRDEVTDVTVFTLKTRSITSIRGVGGTPSFPYLVIRCEQGPEAGPEVFLSTTRAIDEEVLILRWDQQPPDTTGLWSYSRDYSALFADYPVKAVLDLATHKQLLARYYPFAEGGPQTVKFVLGPLAPFATDLERYCGLAFAPMIADYKAKLARERATNAQLAATARTAAAAERAAWNAATAKVVLTAGVPTDTALLVNQPLPIRPYILRVVSNTGATKTQFAVAASVEDGGARIWRVDGDTLRIDTPGKWLVTIKADGVSADHTLHITVTDSVP